MFFARFAAVASLALCLMHTFALADSRGNHDDARVRREARRILFEEQQEPVQRLERLATTPCIGGIAGLYPCRDIDLVTFMPLSEIGGGSGNDIWGWTDPMTGREYAIMGRSSGTSFVDITEPESPVYLGNLPPHGSNSSWRDIKVYSNHAYIVSEASGHGMQVFDLTQLRNVPAPPVTFSETAHYGNIGGSHNLAINEDTGFAYVVGSSECNAGPHFINLANPAAPVFAGCHVETIYTHDAQCVLYAGPDPDYLGREICINSNESRVNVIDVTDHSASFPISETTYSGDGYTHQGWLTEDHRYFLFGDELDEQNFGHNTRTRILDMLDLDAPVLIGTWDAATAAIDHNMYTHNGYLYQANYRAGLRILDLSDVGSGNLTEVAYFDTYPSSNSASFNSAWSVYPYFASGNVIVSGIGEGLFILRPNLGPDFGLDVDPSVLDVCDPGSGTAVVQLIDRNGYSGTVSLSASGLPVGTSASFDVNPVIVPGSSTLIVDAIGAAAGTYLFTVTGDDGTISRNKNLQLRLATQLPGQPTNLFPADERINSSLTSKMGWSAAAEAESYTVEVATDPAFATIVYTADTTGTTHRIENALAPTTTHYWRVRASNGCGAGLDSVITSFTTLTVPGILLVDDDDNAPDVVAGYALALAVLGRHFDLWNTDNSDDEPTAATLDLYETVIWFTGDEFGGAAGPGAVGEQALAAWLDTSRCLLISSQDYYFDRGLTGLMTSYLGLDSATSDVSQSSLVGLSTFAGLGPYTLSYPYSNFTDMMISDMTGADAFSGDQGIVAVQKDSGFYRTSYWSFGVEALPTPADRQAVLEAFLAWCDPLPTLDGDTDGTLNADDCAPGDSVVWAAPSAASGLTVSQAAQDNLSWSPPVSPGATVVTYDVLRSSDPDDFMAGTCVETGVDTVATDAATPASGEFWNYLIRVQNDCGSTLGDPARQAAACP